MIEEKEWKEFRESGLLWWINMNLHAFGWALVAEFEGDEIKRVYPSRVKFRGFEEKVNTEGYQKLSGYLVDNAAKLYGESYEEEQ
ncbi:hypothetical protein [Priestia megaterium]|uniref:hypothetical protein n=1 Tax=Priestia megaterium TaxID=1404 RepID=UPI00367181CA